MTGTLAAIDERWRSPSRHEPIGMVATYSADSAAGDCELVSMWTAPETRGRGVGGLLVEAVIEWAGAEDYEAVRLWVVSDNESAQRLYRRCGFELTGETSHLPHDPSAEELRMAHDLATETGRR